MRTALPSKWFRLYAEFATDPKVQMLSETDQRRFIMLLCMRCSNGDVTLHDEEIAFQLRISDEQWCATKHVLAQKMLINAQNKPCAWDRRQFASDSSAERVSEHRARLKCASNNGVTLQLRPVEAETEMEAEEESKAFAHKKPCAKPLAQTDAQFEKFWSAYPKRKNRGRAEKAWAKIKPDAGLVASILEAVEVAKAGDDWREDGGKYIPYPESWLSAKGWLDAVSPAEYSAAELHVVSAYNAALEALEWAEASASPYSPERGAAIREFLKFSAKPDWVNAYFGWLGANLPPRAGCGFDWAIKRETYLRAKEGNFSAMKEAA